jgi:hypothetical protein
MGPVPRTPRVAYAPGVEEPLEGIAQADARLGRPFPLPAAPLPLARWVEVMPVGAGAEVAWNLDDTRPGAPGRLALYAGAQPPPARELPGAGPGEELAVVGRLVTRRCAPLEQAQASLRPVCELAWSAGGLHLRLTAQGPWREDDLLAIVTAIET